MRLLIDIGNTRIKWAFADNGKLSASGVYALRQDGELDANGIASLPHQWQHTPTSAFVVNVAGSAAETALREMLIQQFAIDLQRVRTTERCGAVVNGYRSAAQLGTDRWAAIVAAWNLYGSPVCVIDAGTATTIDAVGDDGRHLGGIIVPGLTLMQAALQRDTSDIDRHIRQSDGHKTERGWYGRETKAAVEQGVEFMLCAAINRAIAEFISVNPAGKIILTGGDGEHLLPLLHSAGDTAVELRPLLVLEGLNLLADNVDA